MTAIVILAAGPSSRLGRPKQNIIFEGQTLLQRVVQAAKSASHLVILVLGANTLAIEPTIENAGIEVLDNKNWMQGMSSSIKQSVAYIQAQYTQVDAILFLVCDQPHVSTDLLQHIIAVANSSDFNIIACDYKSTIGVPALFKKKYFSDLLELSGNEGAKHLLNKYLKDVHSIPFEFGHIDIDTIDDLNYLL